MEVLTAREAQCDQLEETLEVHAISLTRKNALIEGQGEALLRTETALQAAWAEIDQGRKRIEGKY